MKVEISLYYQSQRITTRLEPVTPPFMYIPPARITMCGQLPLVFLPLSFFNTEAILHYNYCTLGLYTRELAFWPDRNECTWLCVEGWLIQISADVSSLKSACHEVTWWIALLQAPITVYTSPSLHFHSSNNTHQPLITQTVPRRITSCAAQSNVWLLPVYIDTIRTDPKDSIGERQCYW